MKKAECEKAIRHLCHQWRKESGHAETSRDQLSFSAFHAWVRQNYSSTSISEPRHRPPMTWRCGSIRNSSKAGGGFAERFRIAGPGDLENPGNDTLFLPYWLLNRDEMLSMILDRSDQNAPNQASRFTLHVRSLKGRTLDAEGKAGVKKTYTVDSPIPYDVKQLVGLLHTDDKPRKCLAFKTPAEVFFENLLAIRALDL